MDTLANLALGAVCGLLFYEAVKIALPRPIRRKTVMHGFEFEGKFYTLSSTKARFLVETANGTSSYTLERGFGCEPEAAIRFYNEVAVGGNKKKRLTLIDGGQRTVIARTK